MDGINWNARQKYKRAKNQNFSMWWRYSQQGNFQLFILIIGNYQFIVIL